MVTRFRIQLEIAEMSPSSEGRQPFDVDYNKHSAFRFASNAKKTNCRREEKLLYGLKGYLTAYRKEFSH